MTGSQKDLVSFRPHAESDKNFIYATWLRGLYYGSEFFREMNQNQFFAIYQTLLDRLLSKPGLTIQVACLKEDSDVILGYAAFEPGILHFVFVKDVWRKMGIAKDLVPESIRITTHLTKVGRSLKPVTWTFNPFLI